MAAVAITSVVGVIGAVIGAYAMQRVARDEQEKRQLRWFWLAVMATCLSSSIGFEVRARLLENEWGDVLVFGWCARRLRRSP